MKGDSQDLAGLKSGHDANTADTPNSIQDSADFGATHDDTRAMGDGREDSLGAGSRISDELDRTAAMGATTNPASRSVSSGSAPAGGHAHPDHPTVEGFSIIDALGRGGMGTVWRAVQLSTDREVALKLLSDSVFASEKAKTRFEREVKLAARLEHTNIATVYDSGIHRGRYYYAMQLVAGVPLDKFVQTRQIKRRLVLELMRIVCHAVQHAHQLGVVHRDLKPSNIVVTDEGKPIVLDFGLAKTLLGEDGGKGLTHTGDIAGTPAYMAPEQAEGRIAEIGPQTDVYALGAILYQLLLGEAPTDLEGSHFRVLQRIVEGQVRRPSDIEPAIDKDLEVILLRTLAMQPTDRFRDAGELAAAIERWLGCARNVFTNTVIDRGLSAEAANLPHLRRGDQPPQSVTVNTDQQPSTAPQPMRYAPEPTTQSSAPAQPYVAKRQRVTSLFSSEPSADGASSSSQSSGDFNPTSSGDTRQSKRIANAGGWWTLVIIALVIAGLLTLIIGAIVAGMMSGQDTPAADATIGTPTGASESKARTTKLTIGEPAIDVNMSVKLGGEDDADTNKPDMANKPSSSTKEVRAIPPRP